LGLSDEEAARDDPVAALDLARTSVTVDPQLVVGVVADVPPELEVKAMGERAHLSPILIYEGGRVRERIKIGARKPGTRTGNDARDDARAAVRDARPIVLHDDEVLGAFARHLRALQPAARVRRIHAEEEPGQPSFVPEAVDEQRSRRRRRDLHLPMHSAAYDASLDARDLQGHDERVCRSLVLLHGAFTLSPQNLTARS
jgi:hypothetical protein